MSSENPSTRDRILDATCRLVQAPGSGTRMADIARAAGVSRQAVYLHFENRADLLTAAARHIDERHDLQALLAPYRAAEDGREKLRLYIAFWGGYLPVIQGMARAFLAMRATDAEARAAWDDRMAALHEGCEACIAALEAQGQLDPAWTRKTASDLLWTMLSFETWDQLTVTCGWSEAEYIARAQHQAERVFLRPDAQEA